MTFTFFINWAGSRWQILKTLSGRIGKNWAWEFSWYATHSWIMIDIVLRSRGDHRGVFLMLGLLGRAIDINVYDVRHEALDTDEE